MIGLSVGVHVIPAAQQDTSQLPLASTQHRPLSTTAMHCSIGNAWTLSLHINGDLVGKETVGVREGVELDGETDIEIEGAAVGEQVMPQQVVAQF